MYARMIDFTGLYMLWAFNIIHCKEHTQYEKRKISLNTLGYGNTLPSAP